MSKPAARPKEQTIRIPKARPKPEATVIPKSQPELPQLTKNPLIYAIDALQRSVLFLDTLRQRADNMIEHERNGMPPLLDFKYETVLDACTFDPPANYALLKITEIEDVCLEDCLDPDKPPVIIVDPRAGHGPGIGGFKRDSEIGIAIHEGYPVYFVIFYPDPEPHQKIADVLHALRKFVEKAKALHGGKAPILYGNCQAGWMLTILAADCQGLIGPVVTNGSPLSYWASGEERNPMQIMGSLAGGAWIARFLSDLGNGTFDGAWLVQNFENLNPANALWEKYYNLYANIDTERERFLEFERWWTGFYRFSEEEITATVENLFIGDKLERGEMQLHEGCTVNLKRIKSPLLVFASHGDNITPPRQALHWIRHVYPTTDQLKAAGQRIAYLINPHVGHLGIFVSAKVAKLEHRAILEHVRELESMKPGLYEMKIANPTGDPDCSHDQYKVRFEERRIEDLCESIPDKPFEAVRRASEWNDQLYRWMLRPWVRAFANPFTAETLRRLHPMRITRTMWSEQLNPAMWGIMALAPVVQSNRLQAAENDPLREKEKETSALIAEGLHKVAEARDDLAESLFRQVYG